MRQGRITLVLALFLLIPILPNSPLVDGPVSAEVVCCTASETDLFLLGPPTSGSLTPFENDLVNEERVSITSAIQEVTEIGRWSVILGIGGAYGESNWNFEIPYQVENSAGVQVNATLELFIGVDSYIGETQLPSVFLPGDSIFSIDIPVEAGFLSAADDIEIVFSVRELVFESPVGDSSIEFVWGSTDFQAAITGVFPIVEVDMRDAIVSDRTVHFPIHLNSGFGEKMYTESTFTFAFAGIEVTTPPVVEQSDGDILMTYTWTAPQDATDGTYTAELSIRFQSGGAPLSGSKNHEITFDTGGGGGGDPYYPATEPLRTGGSVLSVAIEMEFDGDEVQRTSSLHFSGAMALWVRWGLDNIGNESLDSASYWRKVDDTGLSSDFMNNKAVDDEERTHFSNHLAGSSTTLPDFLVNGLALDAESLLGGSRTDFNQMSVNLLLGGVEKVDGSDVTLVVTSRQLVDSSERMVLIESFLRTQPTPIWNDVSLDAELRSGFLSSVGSLETLEEGISVTHLRLIFDEVLSVEAKDVEQGDDFLVAFTPSNNLLYTPLLLFILTIALMVGGFVMSITVARHRKRLTGVLFTLLFLLGLMIGYVVAMPGGWLYGAIGVSIIIVILVSLLSPRTDSIEFDNFAPVGTPPSANSRTTRKKSRVPVAMPETLENVPIESEGQKEFGRRKRKGLGRPRSGLPEIPLVDCPKCGTSNPVASDERPLRLPCGGCGTILKIVD